MSYLRQKCVKIPGSSRKEWISPEGDILHYRHIYMRPYTWAMLADLAKSQGISGSQAVERLIAKAVGYDIANLR